MVFKIYPSRSSLGVADLGAATKELLSRRAVIICLRDTKRQCEVKGLAAITVMLTTIGIRHWSLCYVNVEWFFLSSDLSGEYLHIDLP
ncbi:hypothetical protein VNO77_26821 [Canavalia gladiata]|uniref:Uncharacterized protein n=1 Tax=Canavalia gladiata TaxID=3824 RepID=A0AAN9KT15_CANGL